MVALYQLAMDWSLDTLLLGYAAELTRGQGRVAAMQVAPSLKVYGMRGCYFLKPLRSQTFAIGYNQLPTRANNKVHVAA